MRHLILVLFFLLPSLSWAQGHQDDGLLWVALNLIDQDRVGQPIIETDWVAPCSDMQPKPMPHGFVIESPDHKLAEGMCEQIFELQISGYINDRFMSRKSVSWNPSGVIGIPREMTRRIKIVFPALIDVDERVYHITEPIILRPTGSERVVTVDVPARQLTAITIMGENPDLDHMFAKLAVKSRSGNVFLLPEAECARAPKGHLLNVRLTDSRGATRQVTPAIKPESYVDLVAVYGWTYHIEIVPKQPSRIAKR